MSAVFAVAPTRAVAQPPARLALLGTGTVGNAVLQRLAQWQGTPLGARLSLVHAANSRHAVSSRSGIAADGITDLLARSHHASTLDAIASSLHGDGVHAEGMRIVIDATASEAVAERHASWLAQGIHVVTACKLGQGTSLARWRAIHAACTHGGTRYGDSATVGAGLPLLDTISKLQESGDDVLGIEGCPSGTLGYVFGEIGRGVPFSVALRAAIALGYTEPDPRDDLSGMDVARKALILAQLLGYEGTLDNLEVESLVPEELRSVSVEEFLARIEELDPVWQRRVADVRASGRVLLYRASVTPESVRVGLVAVGALTSFATMTGTDNQFAITTTRYRANPIVITGPGAGVAVTAAGVFNDVLKLARWR